MIELAGRVWETGTEVTLRRLRRQGFPLQTDENSIRHYQSRFLAPRRKTAEVWELACKKVLTPSAVARGLMHRLHLQGDVEQPRWSSGGGQMLGSLPIEDIVAGLGIASPRRIFPGRGWDSTLLFPFYDLPGRISGFLVVGRETDPKKDWIVLDARTASRARAHPDKLGLAYHPAVPAVGQSRVYVAEDPVVAYRLQERHLRFSSIPLPIVAKPGSRHLVSPAMFQLLAGRELRVWGFADIESAVCQAVPLRAGVALAGPEKAGPDAVKGYFTRFTTEEIVGILDRETKPWSQVLSRRLESPVPGEAEAMLSRLEAAGFDLRQVRKHLSPEANQRVQSLLDLENVARTITVNRKQITEKNGHWYVSDKQGSEELIVNAVIRLDYVIQHARVGRAYYHGRILWQGDAIEFSCPKKEFDRDPLGWTEQFLLDRGRGILQFSKRWSSQIVFIASQFHQPRFVTGADRVGYEREANVFRMPDYDLRSGGEIVDHEFNVLTAELPATELAKPRVVTAEDFKPLRDPLVYAVLIAFLRNIVAPFCGEPRTVIGLVGAGADGIGRDIGRALGCHEFTSVRPAKFETLWEEELRHDWPVLVDVPPGRKTFSKWIYPDRRMEERNCVLRIDWHTWQLQRLLGEWMIVQERQSQVLAPHQKVAVQDLVPAYLHDIAKRHFVVEAPRRLQIAFFWERVFWDFFDFMRRSGSRYDRPSRPLELIHPRDAADRALGFAELLGDFASEGRVLVVPDGFEDETAEKPQICLLDVSESQKGIRVRKADFVRLLAGRGALLTDLSEVSLVLAEAGVLIEDADGAWTVDYEWWRSTWRQGLSQSGRHLKLLG